MPELTDDVLYEPVLLTDDEDGIVYQAGAFLSESDAQAVLEVWRTEGRTEAMAINVVSVFANVEDWKANR